MTSSSLRVAFFCGGRRRLGGDGSSRFARMPHLRRKVRAEDGAPGEEGWAGPSALGFFVRFVTWGDAPGWYVSRRWRFSKLGAVVCSLEEKFLFAGVAG